MIEVKHGEFGALSANNFLITDKETGKSALVDCSSDGEEMRAFISGTDLEYILLTHGHFDHCDGVRDIAELTGAKIVIAEADRDMAKDITLNVGRFFKRGWKEYSPDITVAEGDTLSIGEETISVISTPGHTPGSVCYLVGEHFFTGDTIMVGGVGRTDFPGGSQQQLIESLRRIMPMTEKYSVYPGHGEIVLR